MLYVCLQSLFYFPRTPRTAGSQAQQFTQYEWTAPGNKPSSPFIAIEKKKEALIEHNKPRPGTAEAEIEGKWSCQCQSISVMLMLTKGIHYLVTGKNCIPQLFLVFSVLTPAL